MNHDHTNAYTRRDFLRSGLMLASASLAVPAFITNSAMALNTMMGGLSSRIGVPEDHVLVVVQLSGGNDGLNTVVPYFAPQYAKLRPGISISEKDALKFDTDAGIGLHPQLGGFKDLHQDGMLGIVQGVGYPNPNRSHFKSMDIWQTGDVSATGEGWLGKYFDSECCGFGKGESGTVDIDGNAKDAGSAAPPGISIGRTSPMAMEGRQIKPVNFETADLFRWTGQDMGKSLDKEYQQLNNRGVPRGGASIGPDGKIGDTNADFLLRTALDAQVSSDLIRKAVSKKSLVNYPNGELAKQLAMVGLMIRAGLKTRVYYVSMGGFDTHAGQGGAQGRHGQLLNQVATALKAFYQDLKQQGNDARVLTMTFSEFGRRVGQNASGGTDHGTAAPLYLTGPMVRTGLIGDHPSLTDLDEGDLKYKIDFRSVYAGILSQWMGADPKAILGEEFKPLPVLAKIASGEAMPRGSAAR